MYRRESQFINRYDLMNIHDQFIIYWYLMNIHDTKEQPYTSDRSSKMVSWATSSTAVVVVATGWPSSIALATPRNRTLWRSRSKVRSITSPARTSRRIQNCSSGTERHTSSSWESQSDWGLRRIGTTPHKSQKVRVRSSLMHGIGNRQTDIQTDRQTYKRTDRQTDGQIISNLAFPLLRDIFRRRLHVTCTTKSRYTRLVDLCGTYIVLESDLKVIKRNFKSSLLI